MKPGPEHSNAPYLRSHLFPVDALPALLQDRRNLAIFGFGGAVPESLDDLRYLHIPLHVLNESRLEVWRTPCPAMCGFDHDRHIAWSKTDTLLYGVLEIDEAPCGIEHTACEAYRRLTDFNTVQQYPHVLRIWNYMDAIIDGNDDQERYRQFCVGRARGMRHIDIASLPAATGIGRFDGVRRLQVYWLAMRAAGIPIENPRQISAYRYPRRYGMQPPSFARAMLPPETISMPLMISGTAAIVGHQSRHPDSITNQVDEIVTNLDTLISTARQTASYLPPAFGPDDLLKIYVRDQTAGEAVAARLKTHIPDEVPKIFLHGAVCRRELAVEIEAFLTPGPRNNSAECRHAAV